MSGSAGAISQKSKAFLIDTFTDLRADLEGRLREGGPGGPEPEKAAGDLAMYEALLAGLTRREAFPDDEGVREYVAGLAIATDEANGYERAVLEHEAFAELVAALAR